MAKLTDEIVNQRVFENSLNTCEYVSGYETANSTIKVKCIVHDFEFETKYENVRRSTRKHHICPKCQEEDKENKYANSRQEVECAYCKKKVLKPLSKLDNSRSGLYFCCREHKDLAQRLESGQNFNEMRPDHYGKTEGKNYREKSFRAYEHKCAICEWNEDKDVLEVHHIDENRNNNDIFNLIILCPICHRKLTTGKYVLVDRKYIQKKENN